jgi:hypothetical protein
MAPFCSLLKDEPHRLLCPSARYDMAFQLQQKLVAHLVYCATMTKIEQKKTYSLENFEATLEGHRSSTRRGHCVVAGGLSEDEGEETRQMVAARKDETGERMEFVKILGRTLEQTGPGVWSTSTRFGDC